MKLFRFDREFKWWAPSPNCVLCKALSLFVAQSSPRAIPIEDDVAELALRAGAGEIIGEVDARRDA